MTMDQTPPVPDVTSIAGPYLLGHMTSYAAFGILCLQIYMYHVCFGPSDRRWLQVLVWMVFLISLVFQVCETYEVGGPLEVDGEDWTTFKVIYFACLFQWSCSINGAGILCLEDIHPWEKLLDPFDYLSTIYCAAIYVLAFDYSS
ncbi:hypothetical protein BDP27DRAFT_1403684, partial [Rhodocollybia butyracea]